MIFDKMQGLSKSEGIEKKAFTVTGGVGFLGSSLCLELVRRGAKEVRSFDLNHDQSPFTPLLLSHDVCCITSDICKFKDVEKSSNGVDCVFHFASFRMSGKEMLQSGRVDEVNIDGTCHLIDACMKCVVKILVYESTYNVVYGGKEIINGNETQKYFPLEDHVDPYGRSKALAEQLVLKSNGRELKRKAGKLYTCAIRPAAIYGPGEERHLPRILSLAELGLLAFKVGGSDVKNDWVYVDNLVHAFILASMGLLKDIPGREGEPVAAGQAYFISDGSPVNTFEFLHPILESLDYDIPRRTIAVHTALIMAWMFWGLYSLFYPWLKKSWLPQPFLLPAEVYKVGVTHYFSILKANKQLGYTPIVKPEEGVKKTIAFWKEKKKGMVDCPNIFAWLFCIGGMLLVFLFAFVPDQFLGPLSWMKSCVLVLFGSVKNIQIVFYISSLLHFGEAVYAWSLARRVAPSNVKGWFWQTFALGFPSLRLLLKRAKKVGKKL